MLTLRVEDARPSVAFQRTGLRFPASHTKNMLIRSYLVRLRRTCHVVEPRDYSLHSRMIVLTSRCPRPSTSSRALDSQGAECGPYLRDSPCRRWGMGGSMLISIPKNISTSLVRSD